MPKRLRNITEVSAAMDRFLRERGLKSNDGHYTALTAEDLKTGGWKGLKINPAAGFMIRYYDVKGGLTDFCRFRYLEQPVAVGFGKLTERERDEFRYVQPAGVSPQVYFPKGQDWNRFFSLAVEKRTLTITEGELKADCACKLGIPTIALGGVNCFKAKDSETLLPALANLPLRGMKVEICYDSDAVTNERVLDAENRLAGSLEAKGAEIRVRRLPALGPVKKTGIDDYLVARGRKFYDQLKSVPWYSPSVPRLIVKTREAFLAHRYPSKEEILTSKAGVFMTHPSITEIHAYRGVGKTNVAFHLASALATKGKFLRWQGTRPLCVLYVEGEQPASDLQERIRLLTQETSNFYVMSLEDQEDYRFPKIITPEGQKAFERVITENKIDVVIIDSLSTLANVAMNDEENQLPLGDWFVRLRTGLRVSVVYLQHDGKGGQQRGHSKHEDWIDLGIHLTWLDNYTGTDGLRCRFNIDKARRPIPDGQAMSLRLGTDLRNPGRVVWDFKTTTAEMDKRQQILEKARGLFRENFKRSTDDIIKLLRKSGLKGKNKLLRETCDSARESVGKETGKITTPKWVGRSQKKSL